MQLLQETFIIENLQVLSEGKGDAKMRVAGIFGRTNEKNNNGRIYPTAVLESQLQKVAPLISERRLCGELDHPQNDTVKLSNASHLITKLSMKGNELIGEAELLNTPAGLTAQALINGGVKIGISSRGMGTLSEDQNGDKVVNEDFRLVTFDLVADPSTRGAFPGLAESTESQFVRESQDKLSKESNFITMLEAKMKDAYQPWIDEAKLLSKRSEAVVQKKLDADAAAEEEKKKKKSNKVSDAFELVKADGHWHRIAEAIATAMGHSKKKVNEDFEKDAEDARQAKIQDRLSRRALRRQLKVTSQAASSGEGPGFLARRRIVKGKEAEAKGDVRASRIRARGEAGGRVGFGAGSAGYAARTAEKEKKTYAPKKPGMLARWKASRAEKAKASGENAKPEAAPKARSRTSPEERHQREVLGRAQHDKDVAAVRSQAQSQTRGTFGAQTASRDTASQKWIARQNRKRAAQGLPPIKMTAAQAARLDTSTAYKRLGNMLAEMLYLREGGTGTRASKRTRGVASHGKKRKFKSGEGPQKNAEGKITRVPISRDETEDKREHGSIRA